MIQSKNTSKEISVYKTNYIETYHTGKIGNGIFLDFRKLRLELAFQIDANKSSMVSCGPWIILPLPVIPWPTGIWNAFKHSSPKEFITEPIKLSINARRYGSQHKAINFADILVTSDPPGIQIEDLNNQFELSGKIELTLGNVPTNVSKISVKLQGFSFDQKIVDVPQIDFIKGKGVRFWSMTING